MLQTSQAGFNISDHDCWPIRVAIYNPHLQTKKTALFRARLLTGPPENWEKPVWKHHWMLIINMLIISTCTPYHLTERPAFTIENLKKKTAAALRGILEQLDQHSQVPQKKKGWPHPPDHDYSGEQLKWAVDMYWSPTYPCCNPYVKQLDKERNCSSLWLEE